MKIKREILITELLSMAESSTAAVAGFRNLTEKELNFKPSADKWSILECIEHLNRYGDFYLPEIERRILSQSIAPEAAEFKSGLIGNYFAELMKVTDGKIKKMKSPRDKDPSNSVLHITTLDRFLKQQDSLMRLLEQGREVDLTKAKASISLTPYIKLRLGDTFRFFVYHIDRHVQQAQRVLDSIQKAA